MRTLKDTTSERIREFRKARGMTQQQLAQRVALLGTPAHQTTIARIESGNRELTLGEAFQYAWALDVAPIHLFVPDDSDEPIHIGPSMSASPYETREWIRGFLPLFQDATPYFTFVPEREKPAAARSLASWLEHAPIQVSTSPDDEG